MTKEERARLAPIVKSIAKYDAGGSRDDLVGLVDQLRSLAHDLPSHYRKDVVTAVILADRRGHLDYLESLGLLSEMARDSSGDVVRAAAFAYWRLNRPERAAQLQLEALSKTTSVESVANLDSRVGSAVQNYRRLGTPEARLLAWESLEQLTLNSDGFRMIASDFVEALDAHSHLDSEVATALLSQLESAEPEQGVFRLAAFVHWRRGDAARAASWQQRSVGAPLLLWSESQLHLMGRRMNEQRDLHAR